MRLPGARGWLLRELGWEIALYQALLETMLGEPEVRRRWRLGRGLAGFCGRCAGCLGLLCRRWRGLRW